MGINLGGLAGAMPQQRLYITQICTLFQQMGGKTMPQRVGRRPAPDSRFLHASIKNMPDAVGGILTAKLPFKQPNFWPVGLIILPQLLQNFLGKQRSAVFLAFTTADEQ